MRTKDHIPLTRIQKLIAERMVFSKKTKPCFYLQAKANVTELTALRPRLKKSKGVRVTTNAFYIRALALAAKEFPLTLGRLDGEVVRIAAKINVGFAVNAPQGLIVPVINDADQKTLTEVSKEENILINRARANQITLREIENETIAMSNLGAYGTDSFIGIVPPLTTTILSVGNVLHELLPVNGDIMSQKVIYLSVAADHRVVNGDYAAKFLSFIKQRLEDPESLI